MRGALASAVPAKTSPPLQTTLPATVFWSGHWQVSSALIDSGAEESFIDTALATLWRVPVTKLPCPLVVSALNGSCFAKVTHRTEPVSLM